MEKSRKERMFSVEMRSKEHVKHMMISDEKRGSVLFEGYLGKLEELGMIDSAVLEVRGLNGVIRLELGESELKGLFLPWKEEI